LEQFSFQIQHMHREKFSILFVLYKTLSNIPKSINPFKFVNICSIFEKILIIWSK